MSNNVKVIEKEVHPSKNRVIELKLKIADKKTLSYELYNTTLCNSEGVENENVAYFNLDSITIKELGEDIYFVLDGKKKKFNDKNEQPHREVFSVAFDYFTVKEYEDFRDSLYEMTQCTELVDEIYDFRNVNPDLPDKQIINSLIKIQLDEKLTIEDYHSFLKIINKETSELMANNSKEADNFVLISDLEHYEFLEVRNVLKHTNFSFTECSTKIRKQRKKFKSR